MFRRIWRPDFAQLWKVRCCLNIGIFPEFQSKHNMVSHVKHVPHPEMLCFDNNNGENLVLKIVYLL